jgi:transcription elongation factor Elf1
MLYDLNPVSKWYVLNQGFKTYSECPHCQSTSLSYFKVITRSHKGIAPQCDDCGKKFLVRLRLKHHINRICANF